MHYLSRRARASGKSYFDIITLSLLRHSRTRHPKEQKGGWSNTTNCVFFLPGSVITSGCRKSITICRNKQRGLTFLSAAEMQTEASDQEFQYTTVNLPNRVHRFLNVSTPILYCWLPEFVANFFVHRFPTNREVVHETIGHEFGQPEPTN